jgi:aromatic ring-opening dioxygenase catalytic subunit (LigB family)
MLPTFFLAHGGGPMPLMGDPPADFLKSIPSFLTQEEIKSVKSILIVSAHWEETTVTVSSSPKPAMLFDYYGFPRHTYEYKYDAPGNPQLAKRIKNLCNSAQINCKLDEKRGFDHATFVPLLLAYPKAEIPVVQMSLQKDLDPSFHIALGEALAPLRDEVLIMASE